MTKNTSLLFLFLMTGLSYGQNDTINYDKNWNECSAENARYYRIYYFNTDSTVSVVDYYKKLDRVQMKGSYRDTSFETMVGHFQYFDKNGDTTYKRTYNEDGDLHGLWQVYNRDGTLCCELTYKDGVKHGPNNIYYKNGQLKGTVNYVNNKLEGWNTTYRKNGSVKAEFHFEDDYYTGNRRKYSRSGNRVKGIIVHD